MPRRCPAPLAFDFGATVCTRNTTSPSSTTRTSTTSGSARPRCTATKPPNPLTSALMIRRFDDGRAWRARERSNDRAASLGGNKRSKLSRKKACSLSVAGRMSTALSCGSPSRRTWNRRSRRWAHQRRRTQRDGAVVVLVVLVLASRPLHPIHRTSRQPLHRARVAQHAARRARPGARRRHAQRVDETLPQLFPQSPLQRLTRRRTDDVYRQRRIRESIRRRPSLALEQSSRARVLRPSAPASQPVSPTSTSTADALPTPRALVALPTHHPSRARLAPLASSSSRPSSRARARGHQPSSSSSSSSRVAHHAHAHAHARARPRDARARRPRPRPSSRHHATRRANASPQTRTRRDARWRSRTSCLACARPGGPPRTSRSRCWRARTWRTR